MKEQSQQSEIPVKAALRRDLKALYHDPRPLPESLDQEILGRIQLPQQRTKPARFVQRLLAAAAILLVGLTLTGVIWQQTRPAPLQHTQVADLDNNGRVDILDAFWLARQLQADKPTEAHWDLNTDGRVDQSDIDLVAQMAVKLEASEVLL